MNDSTRTKDQRLIEDYLPLRAISEEARIENSVTQARGYLSKALLSILHRWWARRPLVACRAAVYAALVPAAVFRPENGLEEKRDSLARANAAKFLQRLCRRTVAQEDLGAAAAQIREANGGKAPRILDQFAGGGSIPLEATRLGCDSYSLELNPVAHLIELATLVYPAKYGKTLVTEVDRWSQLVFEAARDEVGDLYSPITDPHAQPTEIGGNPQGRLKGMEHQQKSLTIGTGFLVPSAYIWTRTVPCKNCQSTVPLHRQTWLRKKPGGFVALRPVADLVKKRVQYELLTSSEKDEKVAISHWKFDPTDVSKGGETECPFCRSVVSKDHVKDCGVSGRMGLQMMVVVATRPDQRGKAYIPSDSLRGAEPNEAELQRRLEGLLTETKLTLPTEPIFTGDSRAFFSHLYGFMTFADHFTRRQLLTLLTMVKHLCRAQEQMIRSEMESELMRAVVTSISFIIDKVAERGANVCRWDPTGEKIQSPIANGKMPMVWDFPEANPFADSSGSWKQSCGDIIAALEALANAKFRACSVSRGSALSLPYDDAFFDAVITDPPYYDNVPYSHLADFFYVWLKRSLGTLYPEHFAAESSPTKAEAVMEPSRHGGNKDAAKEAYEAMMAKAFAEARRVLKFGAPMVCVYAHKTMAGWTTLVDALRNSGFMVTEAWPLDTENPARQRSQESAALASSIFLIARRRQSEEIGSYEQQVRTELESIVRERVETLWQMGVVGADLVIAAVGAGMRAFTRHSRVEYANGEEVRTERFLAEVEGVVLETILEKIFGVPRSGVSAVDGASRFYVLWRYTYKAAELDAGEAIVFTYAQPVEIDGPAGLSSGSRALVEKKKDKYRLRDFTERGYDDHLGLADRDGNSAPLIDVLHRALWLIENEPRGLPKFLDEVQPDRERLRLVAQALAGETLKGKAEDESKLVVTTTQPEMAALGKLLGNWRSLVDQRLAAAESTLFDMGRKRQ